MYKGLQMAEKGPSAQPCAEVPDVQVVGRRQGRVRYNLHSRALF